MGRIGVVCFFVIYGFFIFIIIIIIIIIIIFVIGNKVKDPKKWNFRFKKKMIQFFFPILTGVRSKMVNAFDINNAGARYKLL